MSYVCDLEISSRTKTIKEIVCDILLSKDAIIARQSFDHPYLRESWRHVTRTVYESLYMALFISIEGHFFDQNQLESLGWMALRHDDGKPFVPEKIINKPGPFDTDELAEMRKHPLLGFVVNQEKYPESAVCSLTHHLFLQNPYPDLTVFHFLFCSAEYKKNPLLRQMCALIAAADSLESWITNPARIYRRKDFRPLSRSEAVGVIKKDLNIDDPCIAIAMRVLENRIAVIDQLSST